MGNNSASLFSVGSSTRPMSFEWLSHSIPVVSSQPPALHPLPSLEWLSRYDCQSMLATPHSYLGHSTECDFVLESISDQGCDNIDHNSKSKKSSVCKRNCSRGHDSDTDPDGSMNPSQIIISASITYLLLASPIVAIPDTHSLL